MSQSFMTAIIYGLKVCKRLTNVIFKGDVLHRNDRENQLGCLRRKEKLSQSSTSSPNNTLFRFIILVVD